MSDTIKKMLITATVPSMIGQFNMGNIQILLDMGYEVHVACNFGDYSCWPEERIKEFVKELKKLKVKCHYIEYGRSPKFIRKMTKSFRQLDRLIKAENFTFIHCHTPVAGVMARICCHRNGVKVIYTAHGFHFYDGAPLKNWLLYYPIERFLSRWTDILITINKEDYKRASKKFYAKKTVYIPGIGVDTEKFSICRVDKGKKRKELGVKEDDFLLLSVGELSERKNQKAVIEALHRMKNIDRIVYLAVGKGDMEEKFKRLIAEYGLEDHVRLLGFRTDIDELCEIADCFIHPSIREGLGIAALEAMAAGLPLISADVNGIRDYTEDGVSGCCIDPGSVGAMMAAIEKMRDDREFREQCASNNWKTAKTFDIARTNGIMSEIYQGEVQTPEGHGGQTGEERRAWPRT